MEAWPVPCSPRGRRGGLAGQLGPVGPPWGRGWSPGQCMAPVGGVAGPLSPVWPVGRGRFLGFEGPLLGHCRSPGSRMTVEGTWPVPWSPYGRRGGVAAPLGPALPPLGSGRSPGPRMAGPLGPAWPPWWRGRSTGPRRAAVGAWLVPWATYGSRGSRGRSPKPRTARGAWLVPWARRTVVGASPVPWVPYGRRGDVAGPLNPAWPRGGVAGS